MERHDSLQINHFSLDYGKDFSKLHSDPFPNHPDVKLQQVEVDNGCTHSEDCFHELYIQQHGLEFMTPVIFEDGMDFVECEMYYASIKAQEAGGSFRGLGKLARQSSLGEFRKLPKTNLESCLRKKKCSSLRTGDPERKVRRCSFGGMPKLDRRTTLAKSNSSFSITDHNPTVGFDQYVHVVTIYPIDDLPLDVRSMLWMSRQEMIISIRQAAAEEQMRRATASLYR